MMHDIFTVYKAVAQPGTIRTRKDGTKWVKTSAMKWIPYKEGQQRAQPKQAPGARPGPPTPMERKSARGKAERETTGSTARAKLQAKVAEGKGNVASAQEAVRTAKVAAAKAKAERVKAGTPAPEVKQGADHAAKVIDHLKKNPQAMADLKKASGRTHQSDAEVLHALGGLLATMKPGDITESVMGYLKSGAGSAASGGIPINPLGFGGAFGGAGVQMIAGGVPMAGR